jgi:hypothetical protein
MINTSEIAQLLRPGLKAVFGMMPTYPEQWTELYTTYDSDKYQEFDVEMKYLGPADIKQEGQPISTDTMGQRILTTYVHKRVGLSFTITLEAIEDNLYQQQFPQQAVALKDSLRVTKNILGANVINNAFNPAYPMGDGQAMCSTTHPIDGGAYANTFPANSPYVDFSEAGVEQAILAIQKFPMQSGILAQVMPKKLMIPRELQFAATRLLESTFRVDVGNNDINALYHRNYIPEGFRVNQFFTSPSAWFILTDAPQGLKHYQRSPVKSDTYVDFATDNVMAKATERYSFGCSNPRAIFGSKGA